MHTLAYCKDSWASLADAAGVPSSSIPPQYLAKGNYFTLATKCPFQRLIYPLPTDDGGLGVHLTLDLGGGCKFGPDVEWLGRVEPEVWDSTQEQPASASGGGSNSDTGAVAAAKAPLETTHGVTAAKTTRAAPSGVPEQPQTRPPVHDYSVDAARAARFYPAIRSYFPSLEEGALQPAYSGLRPKLSGPGQPAADFIVAGIHSHGIPRFVALYGIESPGLTSSLALADMVAKRL